MNPLDEIKFAAQAIEDSKRVLLCRPEDQLKCEVYTAGNPLIEVRPSVAVPPGMVLLADLNAIEADFRESMQHWRPTFYEPPATRWRLR